VLNLLNLTNIEGDMASSSAVLRRPYKRGYGDVKDNGDWWKVEARIIRRLQASYGSRGSMIITAVAARPRCLGRSTCCLA